MGKGQKGAYHPSQPPPGPLKATSPKSPAALLTAHWPGKCQLPAGQPCTQTKLWVPVTKKKRSLNNSFLSLFFCCVTYSFFLLVGRSLLVLLGSNPLVLRLFKLRLYWNYFLTGLFLYSSLLAVPVLALFSLMAKTEFGGWWHLLTISFPLFLADCDTNERVRTRVAWRGPDPGVHHAWCATGAAPGEVHLPPALEKPDEWTSTGRGHPGSCKELSCLSTWRESPAEATMQSISRFDNLMLP